MSDIGILGMVGLIYYLSGLYTFAWSGDASRHGAAARH
jgi:hypothetical protein